MEFSIAFIDSAEKTAHGEIRLDRFLERFESPLDFWPTDSYEGQWREGLRRLIEGEKKSALVTAMYPPESANFIMWWVMYRDGDAVIFRNHLLLMDELEQRFDISALYSYVPDRSDGVDEEYPVSEWSIYFESLKRFYLR